MSNVSSCHPGPIISEQLLASHVLMPQTETNLRTQFWRRRRRKTKPQIDTLNCLPQTQFQFEHSHTPHRHRQTQPPSCITTNLNSEHSRTSTARVSFLLFDSFTSQGNWISLSLPFFQVSIPLFRYLTRQRFHYHNLRRVNWINFLCISILRTSQFSILLLLGFCSSCTCVLDFVSCSYSCLKFQDCVCLVVSLSDWFFLNHDFMVLIWFNYFLPAHQVTANLIAIDWGSRWRTKMVR